MNKKQFQYAITLIGLFLLFLLISCAGSRPHGTEHLSERRGKPKVGVAGLEKQIHVLINMERRRHGLPLFEWNAKLADIARKHSRDMGQRNYFAHTSLEGRFLALSPKDVEMLDPVVYQPGRRITLAGAFVDTRKGKIDEMEYVYPVFQIKQIYLWPKERQNYPPSDYYDPWFYPYPYYYRYPWWRYPYHTPRPAPPPSPTPSPQPKQRMEREPEKK